MPNLILQIFLFTIFFSCSFGSAGRTAPKPLIIFHLDLNSVSLDEQYIRKWLKLAADMGYNAVLWEVEDEIRWETCPECVSPDALSKDSFISILKYADELGLQAIPLLQTVGHAEYVLMHEKYHSFREDPERYDCYCTSNPEVRQFLKNWVHEYLSLFGNIKYFHLGGDEAYSFASCPVCSKKAREMGKNHLFAEHILEIAQPILDKGIRPGVWCDELLQDANDMAVLPKAFVIWDWNYWDNDETPDRVMVWGHGLRAKDQITDKMRGAFPEIVDENGNLRAFYTVDALKRFGYDVILCSSTRTYGDGVFAGEHLHHAPNIIGAARKTVETGIIGNCVTSWAIRVFNYETQHAWFYLAPLTLKNTGLSRNELLIKASQDIFGVQNTDFFTAITCIGKSFPFANNKTTGIQWTNFKDSRPAPSGYIKGLIEKWKASGDGTQWKANTKLIGQAPEEIREGITQLNAFIMGAKTGLNYLNSWSRAGYFQLWQALIADEIVKQADGSSERSKNETYKLLFTLRAEYKTWAESWMTPASAEINTGLIFDAIIDYFSENE